MSARGVRVNEVCGATCSVHGSITITFTVGSTNVKFSGDGLVRVGDTGTPSCGLTATATTGSSLVKANGVGVHRVGDTGTITHSAPTGAGTYTLTSGSTNFFAN